MNQRQLFTRIVMVMTLVFALGFTALAQEKVVLRLFVSGHPDWGQAMIERFEALNPDIEIEMETSGWGAFSERLVLLSAAGAPPDVFNVVAEQAGDFQALGFMRPLDDLIERDGFDLSAYQPVAVDMWRVRGQVYALPLGVNALTMYYHLDRLNGAGLPYPSLDDWTWDEFTDYTRKLTDQGSDGQVERWGFVMPGAGIWSLSPWMIQNGGNVLAMDLTASTIERREAVEAIEWLVSLRTEAEVVVPNEILTAGAGEWTNTHSMFSHGEIAMMTGGRGSIGYLTDDANYDVTFLPQGKVGFGTTIGGDGFAIHPQSAHPEEAWRLAQFLVSEEGQRLLAEAGTISTMPSVASEPAFMETSPNAGLFFEQLMYGVPLQSAPGFRDVNRAVSAAIRPVFDGLEPVQNTVESLSETINNILRDARNARD